MVRVDHQAQVGDVEWSSEMKCLARTLCVGVLVRAIRVIFKPPLPEGEGTE